LSDCLHHLDAVKVKQTAFAIQFGERVRELREGRGLSQEALAFEAGLHRTHISLIETAKRSVRLETIEALARALKVQPAEMMPPLKR
jgi:transcriptional regulator with XRE-family HTH domain